MSNREECKRELKDIKEKTKSSAVLTDTLNLSKKAKKQGEGERTPKRNRVYFLSADFWESMRSRFLFSLVFLLTYHLPQLS